MDNKYLIKTFKKIPARGNLAYNRMKNVGKKDMGRLE